jgi:hypothetical protein
MASSGFTSLFRDDLNKYNNILDGLAIAPSQISFGQSALSFYQVATGTSVVMSDGTNTYAQNLAVERIGSNVRLSLRAVSNAVSAVSLVASTSGILTPFRPANLVSAVIYATYPGGSSLPALRLSITTGGVIQIRKLDGSAFSGAGTIAYDECSITYSVV